MRENWESKGTCSYYCSAFGYVYILQGIFSLLTNSSVLFVNIYSIPGAMLNWLDFVGLAIWIIGFGLEYTADTQLKNHLANPAPGAGKFIRTGLWKYSRHPNYFGEAVLWCGLSLIALNIQYGWITLYSGLFIAFMLRFVSGVPFPEKKYENNPDWKIVCSETNCMAIWFPFKPKDGVHEAFD